MAILFVIEALPSVLTLNVSIYAPPRGIQALVIFTGLLRFGLAAAVWQGRSNAVRKCIALILGGQAILWTAWFIALPGVGRLQIVASAACLAIAVGVWRALEWARWGALIVGIVVFNDLLTSTVGFWAGALVGVQIVASAACLAIFMVYMARPSTRDQFASARLAR